MTAPGQGSGPGSGPGGSPGARTAVSALYQTLVKSLVTRGRLIAMGSLGLITIVLAVLVHTRSHGVGTNAAHRLIDAYGLSVLVPVVSLVFATAVLGDPAEDGTLVYLWLRPIKRWHLAVAAVAAALTVSVPLAVVPVALAATITGQGARFAVGATCGALIAAVGYTAVFTGLGLRVRRALAWGLAYLLIWEQAVARIADGAARASISVTSRTVFARIAHTELPRHAMSMPVAIGVPLVAAVVALWFTAWSLDRGEIA